MSELMSNRDQIVAQALQLSPEDRAFVADALEQSLGTGSFASPQVAHAWAEEIERRLGQYDRGETQAIDADAAVTRLRQQLIERRATRATP